MPRMEFVPDNKVQSSFDYPKLSLKKGEKARVLLIEKSPLMEFVHTLRALHIEHGKVSTEWREGFGDKPGKEVPKKDFIGQHLCLGQLEILRKKGSDPEHCPSCKAAQEHPDALEPPKPRYAMHVIRYKTKPGTFEVAEPFSVELLAWVYASNRFDELVDYTDEYPDLRKHDMLFGPCTVENFQKFDIKVAAKAEWLLDPARKKVVAETYENNQCDDLTRLIGRKLTHDQIEDDITKVLAKYRQAYGASAAELPDADEVATTVDVGSLLDEAPDSEPTPADDDKPGGNEVTTTEQPATESPDEEKKEAEKEVSPPKTSGAAEDVDELDALLAGL